MRVKITRNRSNPRYQKQLDILYSLKSHTYVGIMHGSRGDEVGVAVGYNAPIGVA